VLEGGAKVTLRGAAQRPALGAGGDRGRVQSPVLVVHGARSPGDLSTTRFRDIRRSREYRRFRREAVALSRSRSKLRGCQCWSCGQHFLIKQYYAWIQSGRIERPLGVAA
jgi:hypothetical protein